MCLTAGQTSDHIGAKILYPALPENGCGVMLGDDSDEYRAALKAKGITPRIPPRKERNAPASFCKTLYKQRHKIENAFGKLKDWRRIATRYEKNIENYIAMVQLAIVRMILNWN